MNKKRNIIIVVIVFLLVISVGYALFSNTLTINGTATAKGDFNFNTSCELGLSQEAQDALLNMAEKSGVPGAVEEAQEILNGLNSLKETGYSNDNCTVNDNKVSFSANVNFPGALRYFTIKVTNTGSIPLHLKSNNKVDSSIEGTVTAVDGTQYDASMLWTTVKENMISGPDFMGYDGESELSDLSDISGIYINSGESLYFVASIRFDEEDTKLTNGKSFNSFDFNVSETHELVFEQKAN